MKSFKAAVFKLKLSNKKQSILDTQMRLSERAYFNVLNKLSFHVDVMVELDKKGRKEALALVKKQAAPLVKSFPLSNGSKAAIIEEVTAQISSTVELKLIGQDAKLPSIEDRNNDYYNDGLQMLVDSIDVEQENQARDLMATKPYDGMPRPLSWYASRFSDGAMILQDDKNRFFVYLNTHSSKSKFKDKTVIKNMANTRTGEVISFASATGILVPLELSKKQQEEFIYKAQAKSYKVFKRADGYYLATSFEYDVEDVPVETFMGIDRGIHALASYAVTKDKTVIEQDIFDGLELKAYQQKHEARHKKQQKKGRVAKQKWRDYSDHMIHVVANNIVDAALKHKSQVVMEDLSNIANGHHHKRVKFARKTNFSRLLGRQQYQKLQNFLEYKLNCKGLPKPRFIHAAGTSITCNKCGHYDKENRKTQTEFKCTACQHTNNADLNAAANIAMKQHWLKTQYNKSKKQMNIKFADWLAVDLG